MIDIHSHIIPAVDDGSKDIETSLEMLKIAHMDGIKTLIATPHFYRNRFECSFTDACKYVEGLNELAMKEDINIKVLPGQEIFLDKYSSDLYKEGTIGTINKSRYMLVETSLLGSRPKNLMDNIYELKLLDIVPIIAHPERYQFIIEDNTEINDFVKEGCLFQITSTSITGGFGKEVKKTAENLVKNGLCNFIGSDAHTTGRRCPKIREALEEIKKINEGIYENIDKNSTALINNEKLNIKMELMKKKRKLFPFW